jgi:hypothetical protein
LSIWYPTGPLSLRLIAEQLKQYKHIHGDDSQLASFRICWRHMQIDGESMTVSLNEEIQTLQRRLDELARDPDEGLTSRYSLRWPPVPPGLYWQLRWLASTVLRALESMRLLRPDPWPVSLKRGEIKSGAKPVLIWAIGAGRETLREACTGLSRQLDPVPGFAPVLITDVADFAFFSRLGWLVEFVPRLSGEGERYDERKMRFLARLYRGAAVLPVHIGLESDWQAEDFRRHLTRNT